jgi:hypothetical protein
LWTLSFAFIPHTIPAPRYEEYRVYLYIHTCILQTRIQSNEFEVFRLSYSSSRVVSSLGNDLQVSALLGEPRSRKYIRGTNLKYTGTRFRFWPVNSSSGTITSIVNLLSSVIGKLLSCSSAKSWKSWNINYVTTVGYYITTCRVWRSVAQAENLPIHPFELIVRSKL